MEGEITIVLQDGRQFTGHVVINGLDTVDLVWTDKEVNHQVCIPRRLIVAWVSG